MRPPLALALLVSACRPAPVVAPPVESELLSATTSAVDPEPTDATPSEPEPEPEPTVTFVGDGWVRNPDDATGPLLRFTKLDPSDPDDTAPVRAVIGQLERMMSCYEEELAKDPELRATVWIRRHEPRVPDPHDAEIRVDTAHPTALPDCVAPRLRDALPPLADDPYGRYAVAMFPRRDSAPRLRQPELDDEVIERDGGSCWTRRHYPCAPHKHCKAADWERTRCRHPADRDGVALRWAFGPAADDRWPIVGLDLVGRDDGLVWRSPLQADDAIRLGSLFVDDARRHVESFRERDLPGVWWQVLEPTLVAMADRAGVRTYDRRTGEPRFRYVPRDPEAPRMWFDDGDFEAHKGKRRCEGDAGHGAFAAICGEDLLYFDGHVFAVIAFGQAVYLREQKTLDDPGSKRTGGAAAPRAVIRAGGYRLRVRGMVFME